MDSSISVVMPVYNGERFLSVAIESVLGQTRSDFDFHIVDDGSTDGTGQILAMHAARDRRIVVHSLPKNVGLAAALNVGCRAATGALIARMDADDISLPHRFDRQVDFLREHPDIGIVGSYVQVIDEQNKLGDVWPCPAQPGLAAWSMLFFCSLAHSSVIMRRSLLEQAGFYPTGYAAEDYALFVRFLRMTRLANLDEVLLQYRVLSTSYSRAGFDRLEVDSARTLREFLPALPIGELSIDDVRLLRDLSRHRYPSTSADIARLGDLILALQAHQTRLPPLTAADVSAIRKDAGVRLWLLGALALRRRALPLSAKLAARAMRVSPTSGFRFAVKAFGKLT